MKKRRLVLIVAVLLIGANGFAADGDLIVNGNVGIGTTTPTARLDVAGDIKVNGRVISNGTWTNATASRELGTVYQNTSGKTRYVSFLGGATDNTRHGTAVDAGSTNPPSLTIAEDSYPDSFYSQFFVVPNGWYYRIRNVTNGVVRGWFELDQ